MKKDFIKLFKIIEEQVVGILLVRDYVKIIDRNGKRRFSNMTLTAKGKAVMGTTSISVSDTDLERYRVTFPRGKAGPKKTVKERLEKYMEENDCDIEAIINATILYHQSYTDPTFCTSAHYFLYKTEHGETISKIDEYLELLAHDQKTTQVDWRNKLN